MFAGGVEEFVRRERHRRGVKDAAGNADERDYKNEFKRIDDVVAKLRGGQVETKDKGYCEAEDHGTSEDGIDADEEADGDAPGQFLWGGSHAQESENGKRDAAVDPVVMDGRWAFDSGREVGFAGMHC